MDNHRDAAADVLLDGRLTVEKPFGRDLASARDLDARLHWLLRESQILRVDHFLAKEPAVATDLPTDASAGDTRDKKAEVLRAMPSADPQHCVRGQYQGYAAGPGVASSSATETFLALRPEIGNWRWAGVPISCGPARHSRTRSPRCGCSCAARPGSRSCPRRAES